MLLCTKRKATMFETDQSAVEAYSRRCSGVYKEIWPAKNSTIEVRATTVNVRATWKNNQLGFCQTERMQHTFELSSHHCAVSR